MVRSLNLFRFIVERSQVFNLRAAENNRTLAALFTAFYQKKLVTFVRVYSIWYLLFLSFSLTARTKSRFYQQTVSNAY